ncbi:hypothetical protein DCAR_0311608 [Daucus carota subsp. sativus]|uniref:Uncharacterized protein n=1 Tax=Daucus carota subsp. sativus TaxID=79200 RepID=A0A175YBK6_DAUCS|nr:hypothetical protein DCAR_0311608 [Daucus carota subsp. sativus]
MQDKDKTAKERKVVNYLYIYLTILLRNVEKQLSNIINIILPLLEACNDKSPDVRQEYVQGLVDLRSRIMLVVEAFTFASPGLLHILSGIKYTLQVNQISLPDFVPTALSKSQGHKVLSKHCRRLDGAEYQASDLSLLIENTSVEHFGLARNITITKDSTTIIADAALKDEIQARIAQINKELSETDSVYDSEKLAQRIAKLSGRVAVIKAKLEDAEERCGADIVQKVVSIVSCVSGDGNLIPEHVRLVRHTVQIPVIYLTCYWSKSEY